MRCRSCGRETGYAVVVERRDRSNGTYCAACAEALVCVDDEVENSREWRRIIAASGPVVRLGRDAIGT